MQLGDFVPLQERRDLKMQNIAILRQSSVGGPIYGSIIYG